MNVTTNPLNGNLMPRLEVIGSYQIWESDAKKTSSIQVRYYGGGQGYMLKKQYSFLVHDFPGKIKAIAKARQYIQEQNK